MCAKTHLLLVRKQCIKTITFCNFFFLCRRRWCLWRWQHAVRRHLRESAYGRPWHLPQGAEDPERLWKRGGPTGGGRPWHPLYHVRNGGPELALCGPLRGQEPGPRRAIGLPHGAGYAGWKSSSHSPSKREASSVTTPAHTLIKHNPLWFNES